MTLIEDALTQVDSVSVIKHGLPVAFILSYIGLSPIQVGDRVQCSCPFHHDDNPSFDVWREADGTERWGCWPCGRRGDVIDLVLWLWHTNIFTETVNACLLLLETCKQSGWKGPEPELPKHEWDESQALRLVWKAQESYDGDAVERLIEHKGWPFNPSYLRQFGCGTSDGRLVIPFYNQDGKLVAVKHRSLAGDDRPISLPGSQLRDTLYLESPHDARNIVVCEGESDTWTADFALRAFSDDGKVTVCGLPSGAGTPVQPFLSRLRDRRVFLAFDGDEAGWAGEQRWLKAINDSGGYAISLEIPTDQDVVSLGSETFGRLVRNAIEGAAQ